MTKVSQALPKLEARTSVPASMAADVHATYQGSGRNGGANASVIQRLGKSGAFNARSCSTEFIRFGGKRAAESLLLVGLGQSADATEEKFRQAAAAAWSKLTAEKCKSAVIRVDSFAGAKNVSVTQAARAFAEGLILSAYKIPRRQMKAGAEGSGPSKIVFVTKDAKLKTELSRELSRVAAVGAAVTIARDWSNEPSNYGTPEFYAEEARTIAKQNGLACRVLTEKDAEKERMHLFLGVGRGSKREGRIVVIEHAPKKNAKAPTKTVALVGKGVTFDSGGISIKPSMKMEDMKHDMTGAATVMGAVLLAAKWKSPNRVIGIMAFTENMPGGGAIQPGNVIASRNGKTVEVINTDAEGRLILADVLDYAQDLKPDAVVNIATLTGAVSVALGKQCCALMGNDVALMTDLKKAGAASGERMWELPMFDEYFEDLKSDYADMKNSANTPHGGTIRGGIFLKQFIRKGTRWAHLDIASTAYDMAHVPYFPKRGASGMFVRTLAKFCSDFA